ncbi:hypothetical protein [Desulfoluna butyratoxydans]|uniref:hypothetical protein n=1 Tax=Desulfoluna butyratoxydans TaxID=231438 RepID=UPI0015D373DE|nr:hypothetical protein [Desulfoluna butyratoxydans]
MDNEFHGIGACILPGGGGTMGSKNAGFLKKGSPPGFGGCISKGVGTNDELYNEDIPF